jgi:signal transduction histidine kinase
MTAARDRAGDWDAGESARRRRALARYQRESALLAKMQRIAGIGGWEIDLLNQSLTWTAETFRIHEVTPASYTPTVESAINFYVPEHAPILRSAVAQAIESGTPYDLEIELITGQGRRIWVRAIGQVELRAGRPRRLFGLVQDITERRRLDREIVEIERHDQERAVSGLRDDLGQSLTGVSLMLRSLAKDIQVQAPGLSSETEQLISLMNRTIGSCRALAKELSPVSEPHGGLIRALRELALAYGQARGVVTSVRSHGKLHAPLGESSAGHLYKIAQSAISRVLEGPRIRRLTITLSTRADTVTLTVAGDGDPVGDDNSKAARDLSIMRRRAEILGAVLDLGRPVRGGERVTCTLHGRIARRAADLLEQNPVLASHLDFQV